MAAGVNTDKNVQYVSNVEDLLSDFSYVAEVAP